MKNVRDSENESLKSKEIKKSIWINPPRKWLSIADVLSEKIIFKINDAVCQLVDCIDDEYEKILYDVDQKELCIKIPPTLDYDDIFHSKKTFEAQKFLVRLSREKIISNLYLPSSIRFEKTKGTVIVQVRFNAFFLDDKFAFWYALLKPEQLNEEIISFKIIDWESLSKAIEGIKKSKEYKRYKRNKALKDREEKNDKFTILKTKKDSQKEDKKEIETKEKVIIDLQKGIYNAVYPKRIYEISGKRLQTLKFLIQNKSASLETLENNNEQPGDLIVKEIKEINDNVKKICRIKKIDLIVHSKTGGYRLNRDELQLDIKTST